jgi:RNA polymerase sigma factor FliA
MTRSVDDETLELTYNTWLRCGQSPSQAARVLRVSRQTIHVRIKKAKLLFAERSITRPLKQEVSKPAVPKTARKPKAAKQAAPPETPSTSVSEEQLLWKSYTVDRSLENRNRIAEYYWPWTAKAVNKFCNYRHLDERDGYFGAAAIALLSSIPRFCPEHGLKFLTYFQYRMNGALLDQCRESDHAGRQSRTRQKMRTEAEKVVGTSPEDIKKYMGWSDEEYRTSLIPHINSLQDLTFKSKQSGLHDHAERTVEDTVGCLPRCDLDIDDALREMMRGCTLQEIVVMYLLYRSEMTMREAGACVRISESRISQIHSNAVAKMREKGWDKLVECVEKVA